MVPSGARNSELRGPRDGCVLEASPCPCCDLWEGIALSDPAHRGVFQASQEAVLHLGRHKDLDAGL